MDTFYWIVGGLAGFGLLALFLLLPHNLRVWRARRDYRLLAPGVADQALALIEGAARQAPRFTLLRPEADAKLSETELTVRSHLGGTPYAEADDRWPHADETATEDAQFLGQIRLDDPLLGPVWQGRLVVVFLRFDLEQTVRSYAAPTPERFRPMKEPPPKAPAMPLRPLRIPEFKDNERGSLVEALCDSVPGLKGLLDLHTADPRGLLTQILMPGVYGHDLEESMLAFEGGEPALIQNPHEATCPDCGQPMRFLFQFGDFVPGVTLGDAGVCYVYGCDQHPERCKGFVDSH